MGKVMVPVEEIERILASAEPYDPKPKKSNGAEVPA